MNKLPSVAIGMPYDNALPMETVFSLLKTQQLCAVVGITLNVYARRCGVVTVARDMVLHEFLKGTEDKLFWIDSDMVWDAEDFIKLATRKVEVVGAAYKRKVPGDHWLLDVDREVTAGENGLFPIKAMGLGFTVVDRAVLQKLSDNAPKAREANGEELAAVFRVGIVDGRRRGEDMCFFDDVRNAGYTVWMDASVKLGHMGEHNYSGRLADHLKKGTE